jgi:hypothetical protein
MTYANTPAALGPFVGKAVTAVALQTFLRQQLMASRQAIRSSSQR